MNYGNNVKRDKMSLKSYFFINLWHIPIEWISTCLLAPASEFLKKGLLGKYILVCSCQNRQADFLNTTHFYIGNGTNTEIHTYAKNATNLKRKW